MRHPIGSTSWPNRHRSCFVRLDALLRHCGGEPLIAIIGPGAVTRLCRPFLHDAARNASRLRRLVGDAARYSDQLLRRMPFLPLVSLEPLEMESALTIPHRLAIVDISPRVLAAAERSVPNASLHCIDLATTPLPFLADVIIAFNVISRIGGDRRSASSDRPVIAMQNLVAGLRPGGLLLADDRSTDRYLPKDQFDRVSEKTHRRLSTT